MHYSVNSPKNTYHFSYFLEKKNLWSTCVLNNIKQKRHKWWKHPCKVSSSATVPFQSRSFFSMSLLTFTVNYTSFHRMTFCRNHRILALISNRLINKFVNYKVNVLTECQFWRFGRTPVGQGRTTQARKFFPCRKYFWITSSVMVNCTCWIWVLICFFFTE